VTPEGEAAIAAANQQKAELAEYAEIAFYL
jgi:hypothetical protein